ncbi:uncharacterized protein G2W53_028196 [Senna tora]|uniref:Uncharacterized protein n=1 Tax=Senna tora TaxID=362788 RepID=A0A834T347_9FABA|nr:uncharacterized protein G2W53_028196 [Senna tora]
MKEMVSLLAFDDTREDKRYMNIGLKKKQDCVEHTVPDAERMKKMQSLREEKRCECDELMQDLNL